MTKLLYAIIALAAGFATEPAFTIVPAYDGLVVETSAAELTADLNSSG